MKTYEERTAEIQKKIHIRKRNRHIAVTSVSALCIAVLVLTLFFSGMGDGLFPRHDGEEPVPYGTLRTKLSNYLERYNGYDPSVIVPEDSPSASDDNYKEITDNQVDGVLEGDIIKRTDSHIYYLCKNQITAYEIAGEDTKQVGQFEIKTDVEGMSFFLSGNEMFLSEDGKVLTVLVRANLSGKGNYTCVVSLDTTNPKEIQEINRVYLHGDGNTARKVDGNFLFVTNSSVYRLENLKNMETCIPHIRTKDGVTYLSEDRIYHPETLENGQYTNLFMMKEGSLEWVDAQSYLSCSGPLYISQSHIFVANSIWEYKPKTEIVCAGYSAEGFADKGRTVIDGTVRNQYHMDERNGVLRLVTSATIRKDGVSVWNANLVCLKIGTWEELGKVESFAPDGETPESVRFDGDYAYVCTAEVVRLTDPVYFFDLSDYSNITWKDTGTIDGYSANLVDFADGYLLGIGYNSTRGLKIEVYAETETGVESVCTYEREVLFSLVYKAYYINRDEGMIGLGVEKHQQYEYVLLHFDGGQISEIVKIPLNSRPDWMRGVVIDDCVYVFGSNSSGTVFEVVEFRS